VSSFIYTASRSVLLLTTIITGNLFACGPDFFAPHPNDVTSHQKNQKKQEKIIIDTSLDTSFGSCCGTSMTLAVYTAVNHNKNHLDSSKETAIVPQRGQGSKTPTGFTKIADKNNLKRSDSSGVLERILAQSPVLYMMSSHQ